MERLTLGALDNAGMFFLGLEEPTGTQPPRHGEDGVLGGGGTVPVVAVGPAQGEVFVVD
jgi:hypothetical protein